MGGHQMAPSAAGLQRCVDPGEGPARQAEALGLEEAHDALPLAKIGDAPFGQEKKVVE